MFLCLYHLLNALGKEDFRFLVLRATDGHGVVLSLNVILQPFLSSSGSGYRFSSFGGKHIYSGNLPIKSCCYAIFEYLVPPGLKSLSCSKAHDGFIFFHLMTCIDALFLGISGSGSSPMIDLKVLKFPL